MQHQLLFANRVPKLAETTVRDALKFASQPGVMSLSGGIPNPELFPLPDVRQEMNGLLADDNLLQRALQYSPTPGIPELRETIANMLNAEWGRAITANHILITTGSQQALDLLGKTFLQQGDTVLVEDPTYLAALTAFNAYDPQYLPVELTNKGLNTKQLATQLRKPDIKLLYAIPSYQNPTGVSWSAENRAAVLQLIQDNNCLLIEDDPYGKVCFEAHPAKPISASDDSGHSIYLGTFSKTLFPGLRIGYIVAERELIETLTLIKQSMDLHSPTLSQLLIWKMLQDQSRYQQHIETITEYYRGQRDVLLSLLEKHMPANVTWNTPAGGLFIWLTAPGIKSDLLLKKAVDAGVAFMPGHPFYANQPDMSTIRLTYATATAEQMTTAITALADVIKKNAVQ